MSPVYFEILNQQQKEADLAGGTALSLQIQHRYSFDFDLFFSRELNRKDILKLKRVVKLKGVGLNTSQQINIITANDILINLVFYPFKPLFRKIKTSSLPLFSFKDIAIDKAFTIGKRATWRDYVDLFFLLKKECIKLSEILKFAPKKFGFEFNERLFLQQLAYFKDLQITKVSFIKENFSDETIKEFLVKEVKNQSGAIFRR